MDEKRQYDEAVKAIKKAILQSQYEAARSVNEKQLMLYYSIGKVYFTPFAERILGTKRN